MVVPLTLFGICANFYPYLIMVIPLDDQDMCWFYFLTTSPYQIKYLENWVYKGAKLIKFGTLIIQEIALIFFVCKIRKGISSINIAKENKWILYNHILITFLIYGLPAILGYVNNSDGKIV